MAEWEKGAFISLGGMGVLAGTEPKQTASPPTSLMVPLEVYFFLFLGICQLNVK